MTVSNTGIKCGAALGGGTSQPYPPEDADEVAAIFAAVQNHSEGGTIGYNPGGGPANVVGNWVEAGLYGIPGEQDHVSRWTNTSGSSQLGTWSGLHRVSGT